MTQSESITELLSALCAAHLACPPIPHNRMGFSKRGGTSYGYSDLNAIIAVIKPVLATHGLVLIQTIEDGEPGLAVISTTLFHAASGQWMGSHLTIPKLDDMQNFGMTCTYIKRYALQAMLNISTAEEDDDAESVSQNETPALTTPATQSRPGASTPAETKKSALVASILSLADTIPVGVRQAFMLQCFQVRTPKELRGLPYDGLERGYAALQELRDVAPDTDDAAEGDGVDDVFPSQVDFTASTPPTLPPSAINEDGEVIHAWVAVLNDRAAHFGEAAEAQLAELRQNYPAMNAMQWGDFWGILARVKALT